MDESADSLDAEACLQRAFLLHDRNRPAEAAEFCRRGLGIDPHHPGCLALLALSLLQLDGREEEAVRAAHDAVGAAPEAAHPLAVLALARSRAAQPGQSSVLRRALVEADRAVSLDPDLPFAHVVRGSILMGLEKWGEAEASARRALELDPDDIQASSILSSALVCQGRQDEHSELAEDLLARAPEDAAAHIAAGFKYLQRGDQVRASEHFLEALRLDPNHEGARLGLIESFRARSELYRGLLVFNATLQRVTEGKGQWVMLGGYVLYRTLYSSLRESSPVAAALLVGAWLMLALWSQLARGFAAFWMVMDERVRIVLRRSEIVEGLVTGLPVLLAFVLMLGWLVADLPRTSEAPLLLFLAASVGAGAATNEHHLGKWIYGAAAVFVLPVSLLVGWTAVAGPQLDWVWSTGLYAVYVSVAISWLRAFGVLYR